MKHSKAFRNAFSILMFIITLGLTIPASAAPDPNSFTVTYTWKSEDGSVTFSPISQHFAAGQPFPLIHVSKNGYTIDNDKSSIIDNTNPSFPSATFSYKAAIDSLPGATIIDDYIDTAIIAALPLSRSGTVQKTF
ncbi:hypothetical protein [Furfurilactobacillus entadae]|uniref:hypothetical protein n=1 Tax=Furfurilactobacillus entadae TaxID=2922307 RepID=UPI0035EC3D55